MVADLQRRDFLSQATFSVLAMAEVARPGTAMASGERLVRYATGEHGPSVGEADVEAVRAVTASLTALDERMGGGHGRESVAAWLANDLATMCRGRFASSSVRQDLFSAVAQVTYLVGFKSHDVGREALAQRYYLHGRDLAVQSGIPGHEAYFLRILTHHALDIGQPTHSVAVAQAAWRAAGPATGHVRSLYAVTVARAHASAGEARVAAAWLRRAEALATEDGVQEAPPWVALGGSPEARLASQRAKTLAAMGQFAQAERLYRRAADRWQPDGFGRVRGLALHRLGSSQAQMGHLDQACDTWSAALPFLAACASSSARSSRALAQIHAVVRSPRLRASAAARDLRAQVADAATRRG